MSYSAAHARQIQNPKTKLPDRVGGGTHYIQTVHIIDVKMYMSALIRLSIGIMCLCSNVCLRAQVCFLHRNNVKWAFRTGYNAIRVRFSEIHFNLNAQALTHTCPPPPHSSPSKGQKTHHRRCWVGRFLVYAHKLSSNALHLCWLPCI